MAGLDEQLACIDTMDYVKDWKTWRSTLKDAMARAHMFGISDVVIRDTTEIIGDFLAEKACPDTPEEALMKELWDAAEPDERKVLARLMLKICQ